MDRVNRWESRRTEQLQARLVEAIEIIEALNNTVDQLRGQLAERERKVAVREAA